MFPECFSREESWGDWLDHFNNVAAVNGWEAEQKHLWLKVRMTGRAQTAFKKVPNNAKESFDATVRALGERFKPQSKCEMYVAKFQTCRSGRRKAGPTLGKTCECSLTTHSPS